MENVDQVLLVKCAACCSQLLTGRRCAGQADKGSGHRKIELFDCPQGGWGLVGDQWERVHEPGRKCLHAQVHQHCIC